MQWKMFLELGHCNNNNAINKERTSLLSNSFRLIASVDVREQNRWISGIVPRRPVLAMRQLQLRSSKAVPSMAGKPAHVEFALSMKAALWAKIQ